MAEGVVSNWKTRCKAQIKCKCGALTQIDVQAPAGRNSTQAMQFQCSACRKIALLTLHGNVSVTGEWIP